jgi:hypothetical protein
LTAARGTVETAPDQQSNITNNYDFQPVHEEQSIFFLAGYVREEEGLNKKELGC